MYDFLWEMKEITNLHEFLYLRAADVASEFNQRTITDIILIKAAKNLGFDAYIPMMEAFHKKAEEVNLILPHTSNFKKRIRVLSRFFL